MQATQESELRQLRQHMHRKVARGRPCECVTFTDQGDGTFLVQLEQHLVAGDPPPVLVMMQPGQDAADVSAVLRRMADNLDRKPEWIDPEWIARHRPLGMAPAAGTA